MYRLRKETLAQRGAPKSCSEQPTSARYQSDRALSAATTRAAAFQTALDFPLKFRFKLGRCGRILARLRIHEGKVPQR